MSDGAGQDAYVYASAFVEEMARKYGNQRFDAILAFGASALVYALAHRSELEGDAPIVFGGIGDATLAGLDLPADAHGIRSVYSVAGTLELARRLQPGALERAEVVGRGHVRTQDSLRSPGRLRRRRTRSRAG